MMQLKKESCAWQLSSDVDEAAGDLQVIAHLILDVVDGLKVDEPLRRIDLNAVSWLVGHVFDIAKRLEAMSETAMDLHRASKPGLKVAS